MVAGLPRRTPLEHYAVTLVLLLLDEDRGTKPRRAHLWYAEGEPEMPPTAPTSEWEGIREWAVQGDGYAIWFWRRVFDTAGLQMFLQALRAGRLNASSLEVKFHLAERPPIFVATEETSKPLVPRREQSTWLSEFWDIDKPVLRLNSEAKRRQMVTHINGAVQARLGLDLNHWSDRIGNVLLFVPTGVRVSWNYDRYTGSAVLRTDLLQAEVSDYALELQAWEDDNLTYRQRAPLTAPVTAFPNLLNFSHVQMTLWRGNELMYDTSRLLIFRLLGEPLAFGGERPSPWRALERRRRNSNAREHLKTTLDFKFYERNETQTSTHPPVLHSRHEALRDLAQLMTRYSGTIRLWDPYFSANHVDELKNYLPSGRAVQIITSTTDFYDPLAVSPHLHELGIKLKESGGDISCKAWVKGGKDTTFHDRFLLIGEGNVWMLGSSFSGLGFKHSTLIRVAYPDQVISAFEALWNEEPQIWGHVIRVPSQ